MLYFPHPSLAQEDGLLAFGGDLTIDRLILAYRWGIFPWYNAQDPILWWHPSPRFVLVPSDLKISKSMRPYFNQKKYTVTYNLCFEEVIDHCRYVARKGQEDTWITSEMRDAYINLHKNEIAHSVEVWEKDELVGGLYGVALGKIFYGESMFSLKNNASKFGFISLVKKLQEKGFVLIDCQQETALLESLGAEFIERPRFLDILRSNLLEDNRFKEI